MPDNETDGDFLVAIEGPAAGQVAAIPDELIVGRASEAIPDLAADELLSRRHARVYRDPAGGLRIADLGSRNGTYVNQDRLEAERLLVPGDRIRAGESIFEVRAPAGAGKDEADGPHGNGAATAQPVAPGVAVILHAGRRLPVGEGGLTIGRDPANDLVIANDLVSRRHARIDASSGRCTVTDLGSRNGVYVNGEHVAAATRPVHSGDTVVIGGETLRFLVGGGETQLGAAAPIQAAPQTIRAPRERLTIGRDARNDLTFDDPKVSRFHAEIAAVPDGYELRDLGSRNGTRLDGVPVTAAPLDTGSEIAIGPFRLVFDGASFVARDERRALRLDAHEISVKAGGRTLLEPVSLSIEPGELVAVIGEAGSGKSTLVKRLAGVDNPTTGAVLVNGEPVTARLPEIGYVPQFDIVHGGLTGREALTYSAKLRLPLDTSEGEITRAVAEVLDELEMTPHADKLCSTPPMSGGQRKRISVGTELVGKPGLLFLDEPTTGLDDLLAEEMMKTLRKVADDGRAVVAILHRENLDLCDKVVVMGRGGVVTFIGPPRQAQEHFGVATYPGIFKALASRDPREWQAKWRTHQPSARRPAESVFPAAPAPARAAENGDITAHAKILISRSLRLLVRDRRNLLILAAQVPLLSLAILAVIKNPDVLRISQKAPIDATKLLFLVLILAMWFGAFTAGREIVKEREVFLRESAVGVRVESYLLAKAGLLFAVVTLQVALMSYIVFSARPGAADVGVIAILILTGLIGVAMGLLISTLVKNENQASTLLLPIVLPQLLFAGGLVGEKELGAITLPFFSRWSLQGAMGAADFDTRFHTWPPGIKDPSRIPYTDAFLDMPWAVPLLILLLSLAAMLAVIAWQLQRQVPAAAQRSRRRA